MKKFFPCLFVFIISCSLKAQIFTSGNRVCFVGNSITHNGEFHHNIFLYHITRFPKEDIRFYNCGISGDVTAGILARMDDDILVHQPTHIVLMIGMNDVRRGLYEELPTTNPDTLLQRQKAIDLYKANLEKIINIFLQKKIQVILQKPTIYDQTAKLATKNNLGVNDALKICADFINELGNKYRLPVVDYWTIMNTINLQLQAQDSTATLTSKDRVHPQSTGHLIMAYQFLKTLNAPRYVSKIRITAKGQVDSAYNCSMANFNRRKQRYTFALEENALPFPVTAQQEAALQLVPFAQDLNQELLQITGLADGNYSLKIDSTIVGSFSNSELDKGLNLAAMANAPQRRQSDAVRNVLTELWKIEGALRGIKFIEYTPDYKKCSDTASLEAIRNCLEPIFKTRNTTFFTEQLAKYLLNKPQEAFLKNKADELRKQAFELSQPSSHYFEISKQ